MFALCEIRCGVLAGKSKTGNRSLSSRLPVHIAIAIKVKHVLIQLFGCRTNHRVCPHDLVLYVQLKPFWRSQYHPICALGFRKTNRTENCHAPDRSGMTTPEPFLADAMPYEISSLRCLRSSSKMHSHQGAWSLRCAKCVNRHSPFHCDTCYSERYLFLAFIIS